MMPQQNMYDGHLSNRGRKVVWNLESLCFSKNEVSKEGRGNGQCIHNLYIMHA